MQLRAVFSDIQTLHRQNNSRGQEPIYSYHRTLSSIYEQLSERSHFNEAHWRRCLDAYVMLHQLVQLSYYSINLRGALNAATVLMDGRSVEGKAYHEADLELKQQERQVLTLTLTRNIGSLLVDVNADELPPTAMQLSDVASYKKAVNEIESLTPDK